MSQLIQILLFEEGYQEQPYRDTQGFPTVGCGIKLGPEGAALSNYQFVVPRPVGELWMQSLLARQGDEMARRPAIQAALRQCNPPRADVLHSMAYQLGVDGLARFRITLQCVTESRFNAAAEAMLDSLWARQTPERAARHASVMRSGSDQIWREVL